MVANNVAVIYALFLRS